MNKAEIVEVGKGTGLLLLGIGFLLLAPFVEILFFYPDFSDWPDTAGPAAGIVVIGRLVLSCARWVVVGFLVAVILLIIRPQKTLHTLVVAIITTAITTMIGYGLFSEEFPPVFGLITLGLFAGLYFGILVTLISIGFRKWVR